MEVAVTNSPTRTNLTGNSDDAPSVSRPRSRRALLAGLAGGAGAFVASAFGRLGSTRAAAGDPLILGTTNFAGSSATRLSASSSGGAFWMTQNGSGSGVRGEATIGTGGIFVTHAPNHSALVAQHQASSSGTGAALRAQGDMNAAIVATSDGSFVMDLARTVAGTSINVNSPDGVGMNMSIPGGAGYGVFATGGYNGLWGNGGSFGVIGESSAGTGVYGSGGTKAGTFAGDVNVTGTLSKGGGSFRIDHPLDPANKILQHSFVESPDMMNIYNGVVTTDAKGEATVALPAWFEALNRDFRYQLTPIGAFSQAMVSRKVTNGSFSLKTDKPGIEVSWQVTGIRKDSWANAHRVAVEVDKTAKERGLYLHPAEHGVAASKSIDLLDRPQPSRAVG
jgi:hypothetical protein